MHTLAPSASTLNLDHANQERSTMTLNTSGVNRDRVNHASSTPPRRATSTLVVRVLEAPLSRRQSSPTAAIATVQQGSGTRVPP
ncbi:hypothetical protein B0H14DRAFT_3428029 [Mycena olivaceomarginata]|nr:hypothetical protein B0H14DRAFT_3428029 [Mycena olivaceomarginata]